MASSKRILFTFLASLAFLAPLAVNSFGQTPGDDSVELISGQVFSGHLTDPSFTLHTGLGAITLPVNRVASLSCQSPPLVGQTIDTRDGDELIGWMDAPAIHLTGDDGKTVELPLSQVSRVTVAFPATPPAPTTLPGIVATAYSLGGDHLRVMLPAAIEFRTRWGTISADTAHIDQIVLADKSQAAHLLVLGDGSQLSGMITEPSLSLIPLAAPDSPLAVPVGELAKLVVSGTSKNQKESAKLDMAGGDILRGNLQGTITVSTQFGDISVAASDIQKLATDGESPGDLTLTLSDGRIVKAAAPQADVNCVLVSGISLDVPATMIASYAKRAAADTAPKPADTTDQSDQVQKLVKQLAVQNNNALHVRSQNQLVQMGKPILDILANLRGDQPARVQRQIDSVVDRINAGDQ